MTIAIIGCGWFGTPLAERFVGGGHTVFGTTTRPGKLADLAARGIHLHDLVAVVHQLVDLGMTAEVFNVCSDRHRTRQAFYTAAARARGLLPPIFDERDTPGVALVESGTLIRRVGYAFAH